MCFAFCIGFYIPHITNMPFHIHGRTVWLAFGIEMSSCRGSIRGRTVTIMMNVETMFAF